MTATVLTTQTEDILRIKYGGKYPQPEDTDQ
jgi:hypothetical protein